MAETLMFNALREATDEEMARDKTVFVLGEDDLPAGEVGIGQPGSQRYAAAGDIDLRRDCRDRADEDLVRVCANADLHFLTFSNLCELGLGYVVGLEP